MGWFSESTHDYKGISINTGLRRSDHSFRKVECPSEGVYVSQKASSACVLKVQSRA
jgi:hypothetical protein